MPMGKATLGFLGYGNMGQAIAGGLVETRTLRPSAVMVYDADPDKRAVADALGVGWADSAQALAAASDILLVAVKPQQMNEALEAIKSSLRPDVLIVSIAAGISIAYIQARLSASVRVARVMPNTPAMVRAGAAGFALSPNCEDNDATTVRVLFEAVGKAERVSEDLIDAVTGLSGSGPAYFFYVVECLVEAAVKHGLSADQATRLAAQTLLGAGRLLTESGETAASLRQKVTSKGGTTEAALRTFAERGLGEALAAGLDAAVHRAQELGQ